MKIALTVDPEIPVPPLLYGGIERIVEMLVVRLSELGHEVTLFANPDSRVSCELRSWTGRTSQGKVDTVRNMVMLASALYRERFDVVHSFGRLIYLLPVLAKGIPKIMSYQREPTLGQIRKAARLARPGSLHFTGCSDYITRQIQTVATATTVYNCVPIDRYVFRPSVAADAPLVFLGRIEPIKGTHLAVRVAQETGRRLLIAGNIPKEGTAYFEQEIKPHLGSTIEYVGPVNDVQKNDLLGAALAFLMPIQWNEPFGIVMAEAMACGTPVIGIARGSVPEVVEDGATGYACADLPDLIGAVGRLDAIDRKRVRQAAEGRFSDHVVTARYASLYAAMLGRGGALRQA